MNRLGKRLGSLPSAAVCALALSAALATLVSTARGDTQSPGPVLYWPCDEIVKGTVSDASGHKSPGKIKGVEVQYRGSIAEMSVEVVTVNLAH